MIYTRINNLTGWLVFSLATAVYALTVEPTASFWDSGEYIATSYTLGVPHAPGAPFYMLVGRLFSFLSLGNPLRVAYWLNMLSVLCSSFTVLFLFWSITRLGKNLLKVQEGRETPREVLILIGGGLVGALAFTFSDSFWFSAVETELYAMASLFTAVCFWAMLRWEAEKDSATAQRWLILIAYLLGLSVGVHLLALLVLPALALIYYFKKYPQPSRKGMMVALGVGGGLLLLIMLGLGWVAALAASADIFLVNRIGLPFGSGIGLVTGLLFGGLGYGLYHSYRRRQAALHTAWLAGLFVFIGYASYLLIPIRANADPPINLNNPDNVVSFIHYLNREQYGSRPLLHGKYFIAQLEKQQKGEPVYIPGKETYEVKNHRIENVYDPQAQTIFPRMYSDNESMSHPARYRQWTGLREGERPTFADNLEFFFRYQFGHMYARYFLWNFAGRAGERQDAGWLAPWEAGRKIPELMAHDEARNQYWMLPLLLGIIGLFFQYRHQRKQAAMLFTLFFMTGIALVLYANNPPVEPRERDYVYVGNFYTFAMWIGLGVMALGVWAGNLIKGTYQTPNVEPKPQLHQMTKYFGIRHSAFFVRYSNLLLPSFIILACLAIPLLMATENWDDHDRSGRYFSVDAARNTLASCDENAILFTGGDNDTYPLWYVQNVEGFRTDVRVLVTSFANVDWFIEPMMRRQYKSPPLPLSLSMEQYRQGGLNDYLPYVPNPNVQEPISVAQYLRLIKKGSPALQVPTSLGKINTLPARQLAFAIDTAQVRQQHVVAPAQLPDLTSRMVWELQGNGLEKQDLLLLDLVNTSQWQRPIYFNNTALAQANFMLEDYVVQEGDTFRLVPTKNPDPDTRRVDTQKMYERMMHEFSWRGLNNPDTYHAGYYRMFVQNQRSNFNTLAEALLTEGQPQKARQVLNKSLAVMPDRSIPYDIASVGTAGLLLQLGEPEKANHIADTIVHRYDEWLSYLAEHPQPLYQRDQSIGLLAFHEFARTYAQAGYPKRAKLYQKLLERHYRALNG